MVHARSRESKLTNDASRAVAPEPAREPNTLRGAGLLSRNSRTASFHALQRSIGNQAVLRMLSPSAPALQTKLTVNQPGDRFEQEADRVADHVMHMAEPAPVSNIAGNTVVQRMCHCGGECESCKEQEHALLQRRSDEASIEGKAPSIVDDVLASTGRPLDQASRAFFEPRFGADFGDVRVHTGARASESAQAVRALAYTVGKNIVFANEQYMPGSATGQRLLAHELTHVVQQGGGTDFAAANKAVSSSRRGIERGGGIPTSLARQSKDASNPPTISSQADAPHLSRSWVSCDDPPGCPARESGERSRAARSNPIVGSITSPENGEIVFGFDIGSSNVRGLKADPTWTKFASEIASSADRWEIVGFTDCEGGVEGNTRLRQERAHAAFAALPVAAKARIDQAVAAPMSDCVASNDTESNRKFNRSVVFRRTVSSVTLPPENITVDVPHALCGPDVTTQVQDAVASIGTTFAGWSSGEKSEACDALDSLSSGAYAWDIVELHNNSWILNFRPICATQAVTPHCGSSIQIGHDCYYAGSVNYVIFGKMCKLCADYYLSIPLINTGFARFTKQSMRDLVDLYKGHGFTGLADPSANFGSSIAWAESGYDGWPGASTPPGDRSNCTPMCPTPFSGSKFRVNWYPRQFFTGKPR